MSEKKQIVIIDNHDSFTYNLYQIFDEHPLCDITVIQSDKVDVAQLEKYNQIVLSPGPDVPSSYPILFDILDTYKSSKPILGVCLGHQTIGEYFGGKLINLSAVFHGQQKTINILKQEDLLFKDINLTTVVGLYHSWAIAPDSLPSDIEITAVSSDDIIMAISHKMYNIKGIQFHPESYITVEGEKMINNWIEQ